MRRVQVHEAVDETVHRLGKYWFLNGRAAVLALATDQLGWSARRIIVEERLRSRRASLRRRPHLGACWTPTSSIKGPDHFEILFAPGLANLDEAILTQPFDVQEIKLALADFEPLSHLVEGS